MVSKILKILIQKKLLIAFIFSTICVLFLGRLTYRFFLEQTPVRQADYEQVIYAHDIRALNKSVDTIDDISQSAPYDFQKMLMLVNMSQSIKNEIAQSYGIFKQSHTVQKKDIEALIDELGQEKDRLRKYIWDLKGHTKASIPIKKYHQLQYYLEVIDNCTADMNGILRSSAVGEIIHN